MIEKLISLADHLDRKNLKEAADIIDGIIRKYAESEDVEMHTMAWDELVSIKPELAEKVKAQTDDLLLTACGQLIPADFVTLGKGSRRNPVTCQDCLELWKTTQVSAADDQDEPDIRLGLLNYEMETRRTRVLRRLKSDVELLENALIALSRTPPKVEVVRDHIERVVDSLKLEIVKLISE